MCFISRDNPEVRIRNSLKEELISYRQKDRIGSKHDPLEWWRSCGQFFPFLSRFARAVLAVPATSAPVERLFSHAGKVITENRAKLSSDIASDLILLHDYWGVCADLLTKSPAQAMGIALPEKRHHSGAEDDDAGAGADLIPQSPAQAMENAAAFKPHHSGAEDNHHAGEGGELDE